MAKPRKSRRRAAPSQAPTPAAPSRPRLIRALRRGFVVAWLALGLLGALHQVTGVWFLPHLRYGHVMFNRNPPSVPVFTYAGADGVRHDLADLVATPAPGYKRARVAIDLISSRDYLSEVCLGAIDAPGQELSFFVDQYDVERDRERPARETSLRCDFHGVAPR